MCFCLRVFFLLASVFYNLIGFLELNYNFIENERHTLNTHTISTYSTHIHIISVHAHKRLQIIKVLTATRWDKQNETLMVTYKAVRNASPRGPMCFRCLIFNLSGPCELLFLLCFIASWT